MDEKELIGRCIAGDDKSWKIFLKTYGGSIYGTVLSLLSKFSIHEPEIAEDIFAGVIEKLIVHDCAALKRFRWNSKFTTWLISISRNKTYDYLRYTKRKPTVSLNMPLDDGMEELEKTIAADFDLDHDLEVRITASEALDWLAAKERLILKLYYIEGMKEREIAELLKLSVDAVSARKSRALKKLRMLVSKRGG
jgi:RNA polymerase sigma-70 factor (ECF subfamily)